jgi:hypothetical protein
MHSAFNPQPMSEEHFYWVAALARVKEPRVLSHLSEEENSKLRLQSLQGKKLLIAGYKAQAMKWMHVMHCIVPDSADKKEFDRYYKMIEEFNDAAEGALKRLDSMMR